MMLLAWLLLLALFALATWLGRRLQLLPIVSQLLLATLGLPLLSLWGAPLGLGASELLAPAWLEPLYAVAFALLLGHILGDVVELKLDGASLRIALPSFFLPFFCGLACALYILPAQSPLASIAVGLLFALTAIPVLYLYLRHLGYPAKRIRTLLQAAILMDLLCWLIFGLAQGSGDPQQLAWPLLAAATPLLLRALPWRAASFNGALFLALLLTLQLLQLNALVFGIAYLLLLAALGLPLRLPLPPPLLAWLQTWLAVPLILAFGLLQIDWQQAWQGYSWLQFGALLLLPIASKLLGNWLGLAWADGRLRAAGRWRETLLLNTRGLTEIVFLNLLLQQQVIGASLYFALMLMGLLSTLLPALAGAAQPLSIEARSRHEVS